MIKCPMCGETNLKKISETEFECGVCGTVVRDNKLQEILDILQNSPDDFIGNIRFRLRQELESDYTDFALVSSLADKILDKEPTDVLASFFMALACRDRSHESYKQKLSALSAEQLAKFQLKQIAGAMLRFYEPYAHEEIKSFFHAQGVDGEYGRALEEAREEYRKKTDLFDPTLERDILILAGEEDAITAGQVCDYLEKGGYKCFVEHRNVGPGFDRERTLCLAAANCKWTVLIHTSATADDRIIRSVLASVAGVCEDNRSLTLVVDGASTPSTAFYKKSKSVSCEKGESFAKLEEALKEIKRDAERQASVCATKKLDDVKRMLENGSFNRAIRTIEEALDEDCDELALRKMLLRAHAESGKACEREAQLNFEWLKKHCSEKEISALEEIYPCFIDERKEYASGMEKFRAREFGAALTFFEKAAKKNYPEAYCKLGDLYFGGRGVAKDPAKGITYYKEAAKGGNADASRMLGVAYEMGNGVEKNPTKAVKYYLVGAEAGNPFCQCKVANAYAQGVGVTQNQSKAFEWYKKAAEKGWAEAIYELGLCYKYGKGTEVNLEFAQQCFRVASDKGDSRAKHECRI